MCHDFNLSDQLTISYSSVENLDLNLMEALFLIVATDT